MMAGKGLECPLILIEPNVYPGFTNRVLKGWVDGVAVAFEETAEWFEEKARLTGIPVRREVFEEAGVQVSAVSYLSSQPWPFPASLMLGCAGQALSRELTIDPVEIEDALWVTREEMMEVFAGSHPRLLPARRGAIAHFLLENWLADRLT